MTTQHVHDASSAETSDDALLCFHPTVSVSLMLRRYLNVIERARAEYGPVEDMPWSYISELDAFTIYHQVQEKSKPSSDASILEALGHAVAGAAGTAASNVIVYPLDLIVTRLQVQEGKRPGLRSATKDCPEYTGLHDATRKIYRNEGGLLAFYAGVTQDTLKSVIDSFLFFLFYNSLLSIRRNRQSTSGRKSLTRWVDEVGVGLIAGATTRAITMPIQQVITRKQTMAMKTSRDSADKQTNQKQSVNEIFREIYETKGLSGFWAGYSATVILTLNPSLTMSVDSYLQRLVSKKIELSSAMTFLLAATSKATASSVTYPVALAKTRAQASSSESTKESGDRKRAGPGSVLLTIPHIARTNGLGAVYAGLSGEVVKGFFSHGLTMLVKQSIHALVIRLYFVILRYLRRLKTR